MAFRIQMGNLLGFLFVLMTFLFTRGFYQLFFALLMAMLLLIVFLPEGKRLFAWMIIAFFLGSLILGYVDRLIESFTVAPLKLVLGSQFLLLIPILVISYVTKQFKSGIPPFALTISPSLFFRRFGYVLVLGVIIVLLLTGYKIGWSSAGFILVFSCLNAALEEWLWRRILLPHVISLTDQWTGIAIASIAYGLNSTMFGFSLRISFLYIVLGFLFGILTVKSKSILPSFVVHILITALLLLFGWMSLPI